MKHNTWGSEPNGLLKELELIKNMVDYYPIFETFLDAKNNHLPHLKNLSDIEYNVTKMFETLILSVPNSKAK